MMRAYYQVKRNKGAAGVDGMMVGELYTYLTNNRESIETALRNGTYLPQSIRGVEIPKSNGKVRLLGIPTVVDRLVCFNKPLGRCWQIGLKWNLRITVTVSARTGTPNKRYSKHSSMLTPDYNISLTWI